MDVTYIEPDKNCFQSLQNMAIYSDSESRLLVVEAFNKCDQTDSATTTETRHKSSGISRRNNDEKCYVETRNNLQGHLISKGPKFQSSFSLTSNTDSLNCSYSHVVHDNKEFMSVCSKSLHQKISFQRYLLFWNYSIWKILVLWIIFSISVPSISCDLCVPDEKDQLIKQITKSAIPSGGSHSGKFRKISTADTFSKCIMGCCIQQSCNVAFFHNFTCFTIACDPLHPHSCDPLPRKDPKYAATYFVQLRTTDETKNSEPEASTDKEASKEFPLLHSCSPDDDQCPANQKCQFDMDEKAFGYRCMCRAGYRRNKDTGLCQALGDVCEYGLRQCGNNEECKIAEGSKSRQGRCECVAGFIRDADSKLCQNTEDIIAPVRSPTEKKSSLKTTTVTTPSETTRITSTSKVPTKSAPATTTTLKPPTTTPPVIHLTVSAAKNKEIQLPEKEITLKAFAIPEHAIDEKYHYEWSLISGPDNAEKGTMADENTDTLKLSDLIEGLYAFKIVVTGPNKYGEGFVNVTVKAAARTNLAPVAVINPKSQSVVLPKSPILDGSDSTDDDTAGISKYHWEEVNGPIQGHQIEGDEAMLKLTDLVPGNYTFKLTVTDTDGLTNSSLANVAVIKETDYPPKAFPGSDIIIYLPQNEVTLYGNASSDDKGIKSYQWLNTGEDKLAANMQGVHQSILQLSGLQEGDYTFALIVTDTADQTDQKEVHVFVKKAKNHAPVSNPGPDLTISLPLDSLPLEGRNSTDDKAIVKYQWTQLSGEPTLKIINENKPFAMATGELQKGDYSFQLKVTDAEGEENSARLNVHVVENPNKPPVADAGGDLTVYLPLALVSLNGSKSSDDYGIVKYKWTREPESLAAGDVLNGSDHQPILLLANVIPGRYVFVLHVTDTEGLTQSDTATVTVKPDPHILDLLELHVKADISSFTEENKKALEDQLALLLHQSNSQGETRVKISQLVEQQMTGHLIVRFYVLTVMKDAVIVRKGTDAAEEMKDILSNKANILDYMLISVDTSVCQRNCSGHGVCDPHSKRCVCEAFWMENFFKANIWPRESNCDWSILYVVILAFVVVVAMAGLLWLTIYCCRKKSKCRCLKSKRRHRYTLLHETEDKEEIGMIPKASKLQQSSLMMSASDFSSDEETLFISKKKANGHVPKRPNGITRPYNKNKAKA